MPQKPTMPYPHMTTVDADNDVVFSCLVNNRDTITDYKFEIEKIKDNRYGGVSVLDFQTPPYYIGDAATSKYNSLGATAQYTFVMKVYCSHKKEEITESDTFTVVIDRYNKIDTSQNGTVGTSILLDDVDITEKIENIKVEISYDIFMKFEGFQGVSINNFYVSDTSIQKDSSIPEEAFINLDIANLIVPVATFNEYAFKNSNVECLTLKSSSQAKQISLDYNPIKIVIIAEESTAEHDGKEQVTVKENAFYNWSNLKEVSFIKPVEYIEPYAFYYCKSLERVNGLDNLTYVGYGAFWYCAMLESFFKPSNKIEIIYDYAFASCESLSSVVFTKSLSHIRGSAFSHCERLKTVVLNCAEDDYLENSTVKIESTAFTGCSNVSLYTFEDSLLSIEIIKSLSDIGISYKKCKMSDLSYYTPTPIYGGRGSESTISLQQSNLLDNDCEYKWWIKLQDSYGLQRLLFPPCMTGQQVPYSSP